MTDETKIGSRVNECIFRSIISKPATVEIKIGFVVSECIFKPVRGLESKYVADKQCLTCNSEELVTEMLNTNQINTNCLLSCPYLCLYPSCLCLSLYL